MDRSLVGYLAGGLESTSVLSESERIARAVREHRLIVKSAPAAFFLRSLLDSARTVIRREPVAVELDDPRWPAHLPSTSYPPPAARMPHLA